MFIQAAEVMVFLTGADTLQGRAPLRTRVEAKGTKASAKE
jgi:hypothetical protein